MLDIHFMNWLNTNFTLYSFFQVRFAIIFHDDEHTWPSKEVKVKYFPGFLLFHVPPADLEDPQGVIFAGLLGCVDHKVVAVLLPK